MYYTLYISENIIDIDIRNRDSGSYLGTAYHMTGKITCLSCGVLDAFEDASFMVDVRAMQCIT